MLRYRLTLGPLLIAALAAAAAAEAWWVPVGAVVVPLGAILGGWGARETSHLLQQQSFRPDPRWSAMAAALVIASPAVASCPWWMVDSVLALTGGAAAALALTWLRAVLRFRPQGQSTAALLGEVFVVVYVGGMLGALVALRWSGPRPRFDWGVPLLLTTVAVVKSADIGAFTLGRLWGKHPLAPQLSPGKTWEGALGGLAAALAVSWACWQWLLPAAWPGTSCPWAPWMFGGLMFVSGLVGDLLESVLKRDAGQKDSGQSVPGFGGVMDLLDSLLMAAPVSVMFFRVAAGG